MMITKRTQDIPTHLEGIVFDIYQHEYYNKKTDMYLSDDDVEFHQLKPTGQVKQFKEGEAVAQLSYFRMNNRKVTNGDILDALLGKEVWCIFGELEKTRRKLVGAIRNDEGEVVYFGQPHFSSAWCRVLEENK